MLLLANKSIWINLVQHVPAIHHIMELNVKYHNGNNYQFIKMESVHPKLGEFWIVEQWISHQQQQQQHILLRRCSLEAEIGQVWKWLFVPLHPTTSVTFCKYSCLQHYECLFKRDYLKVYAVMPLHFIKTFQAHSRHIFMVSCQALWQFDICPSVRGSTKNKCLSFWWKLCHMTNTSESTAGYTLNESKINGRLEPVISKYTIILQT